MTVEALLEEMRRERISALVDACVYHTKARNLMLRGDTEVAMLHWDTYRENSKKVDLLDILIAEIEKRVS
jgi:hypothetical protein